MKVMSGVAAVLFIVLCGVWISVSRPRPWHPQDEIYLRNVFLLIDQTPSVSADEFEMLKEVAMRKIVQRLGPGDRLYGFRVDADFTEVDDLVIEAEDSLPTWPQNFPEVDVADWPERAHHDLACRWRLFEPFRASWVEKISALQQLPRTESSDYLKVMEYLDKLVSRKCVIEECWLFVLGDLKQEPQPQGDSSGASQSRRRSLSKVEVRLISPHGTNSEEEQRQIEDLWGEFFRGPGTDDQLFQTLVSFHGLPERSIQRPKSLPDDCVDQEGSL